MGDPAGNGVQVAPSRNSHKHFPREACGKGGEAKVAFTLDRAGKLVSTNIVNGTGVPALDDAALEMVKSAQPFPLAPPEVADGDLRFVAAMVFVKPASTSSCDLWSDERLRGVMRSICRGCCASGPVGWVELLRNHHRGHRG
jgi:TonB family protein